VENIVERNMLKKFLLSLIVILVSFSGYVTMQPNEFRIARSLVINASADAVYNYVNEPKKMETWSPWSKLDPNAKMTYSGPEYGIGAAVTWFGNNEMGEGTETIIDTIPNEVVKTRLDFIRPMQATHTGEFIIKQKNDTQVEVTWVMSGTHNFIAKAMSIVFNCDAIVGANFEEGLNNLKTILEKNDREKIID
jgi:hypothetical protein